MMAAIVAVMPFHVPAYAAGLHSTVVSSTMAQQSAVVDSGYCGNQLKWWLESNGTLTISGNDTMTSMPWSKYSGYRAKDDDTPLPEVVIRKVIIDKDVQALCNSAFASCVYLTDAAVGSTVMESLPSSCFFGCTSLSSVSLAPQISQCGNNAFSGCISLQTITLPEAMTSVSESMFSGCTKLRSITLPNQLESIKTRAFYDCPALTGIHIPDSVTSIASNAFWGAGCITVYSNVQYADGWAVAPGSPQGRNEDGKLNPPEDITYTSLTLKSGTRGICDALFSSHKELTALTIPDTLVHIGNDAFNSTGITALTLPASVRTIGNRAFKFCIDLKTLKLEDGLEKIGAEAFSNCNRLTSLTIPSSVYYIGSQAFYDCTALTSIYADCLDCNVLTSASDNIFGLSTSNSIARTVQAYDSFEWLANLASNSANYTFIPKSPQGNGWSYDSKTRTLSMLSDVANPTQWSRLCWKLQNISVGENVTVIPSDSFRNCTHLKSVELIGSIKTVGERAFADCTALKDITFGSTIRFIGEDALVGCTALEKVYINHPVCEIADTADTIPVGTLIGYVNSTADSYAAKYDHSFHGNYGTCYACGENVYCTGEDGKLTRAWQTGSISAVVIPEGITELSDCLFLNWTELESITLPKGLREVPYRVFSGCTVLKTVELPESVTIIDWEAFSSCTNLTALTLSEAVTSVSGNAFKGCSNLTLTVLSMDCEFSGELPEEITVRAKNRSSAQEAAQRSGCKFEDLQSTVIIDSGKLGEYITYTMDNYGNLTITGRSYSRNDWRSDASFYPWWENGYAQEIKTVTFLEYGHGYDSLDIGAYAFAGCESLEKVTLSNSINNIDESAFEGCTSLTTITLPDSLECIGKRTFKNCPALTTVQMSNSLVSIGDGAFSGCINLTDITLPESLGYIGEYAFSDCKSLETLILPESVTYAGHEFISGCGKLTLTVLNVNCELPLDGLPGGITVRGLKNSTAEASALQSGCKFEELETLTFLLSGSLGENASYTLDNYGNFTISGYGETNNQSFQLETINDDIPWLRYADIIKTVTVEEGITAIGANMFIDCTALKQVSLPESLVEIRWNVFCGCTALEQITLPDSVTSIGSRAFSGCGIKQLVLPKSIMEIGYNAFDHCTALEQVTVSEFDTSIGAEILEPNSSESVPSVKTGAFSDCTALTSVTLPDSIEIIENGAFYGCTVLASIVLPESLQSIGDSAFKSCTSLMAITLPKSLTSIGKEVFAECTSLESIVLPDAVVSLPIHAFEKCTALKSVVLPRSLTEINLGAFSECTSLKTINLSNSNLLTNIVNSAFYKCTSLEAITLPDSLTHIGDYAFGKCTALTTVTLPRNPNCDIETEAFGNCSIRTLIAPTGCGNVYLDMFAYYHVDAARINCDLYVLNPNCMIQVRLNTSDSQHVISSSFQASVRIHGYSSSTAESFANRYAYQFIELNPEQLEELTATTTTTTTDTTTTTTTSTTTTATTTKTTTVSTETTSIETTTTTTEDRRPKAVFDPETKTLTVSGSGSMEEIYRLYNGISRSDVVCVVIEDGITDILPNAFNDCSNLVSVQIGKDVGEIGYSAFKCCTSLSEITLPDSVRMIGEQTFYDCSALETVHFGSGLESIERQAFFGAGLTAADIPASVKEIGDDAFYECKSLSSLTLHEGLEKIGMRAFYATALTEVTVPESVTELVREVFWDCKEMTVVCIGSGVTEIPERLLYGCESLTSLTCAGEIEAVGNLAFGATSLTSVQGIPDTALEQYAEEQGLAFIELRTIIQPGDFNGDKEITITDVVLLARFISEDDTLTNEQITFIILAKPDIDADGLVSVVDICLMLEALNENY